MLPTVTRYTRTVDGSYVAYQTLGTGARLTSSLYPGSQRISRSSGRSRVLRSSRVSRRSGACWCSTGGAGLSDPVPNRGGEECDHVTPDADTLRRELGKYRAEWEEPGSREGMIEAGLLRIRATLGLLPTANRDSRLLELGALPFLTTLSLERVWPGTISVASYPDTGEARQAQRLVDVTGGPDRRYELETFNVETDEFPYPDASFDVVLFCELIEHLALNPVRALAEIHRVLKPGGIVVITTPNALSLERLDTYLRGGSPAVDRYMPLLGYGARHNREWNAEELRELLEATGFVIETPQVRDVGEHDRLTRLRRAARRFVLRWWWRSTQSHRSHIFVRAQRGDVFRWRFPPRLYEHMDLYRLVRHPYVDMGVNDTIQCAGGWRPLERCADGGEIRRVDGNELESRCLGFAVAYLRGDPAAPRLGVRLRGIAEPGADVVPGALRVRSPGHRWELLLQHRFTVPAGAWIDVAAPLRRPPDAGEELEVHLEVRPGRKLLVRRVALVA